MAVDAIARCVAVLRVPGMTTSARDAFVGPAQWVVGQMVVEGFWDESDDIGVSAKVLTVTTTAGTERRCWLSPMKPFAPIQIRGDLIVTNETEADFGVPVERAMATLAVAFYVGVALDHPAGHDEILKIDRKATARGT
jgi:hypothetical protein